MGRLNENKLILKRVPSKGINKIDIIKPFAKLLKVFLEKRLHLNLIR